MSRGRDMAEGTLPEGTILFKVAAGSTLETLMVIKDSRVGRSLSSEGSGSVGGVGVLVMDGMGRAGDGVLVWAAISCCRKDGRNHPSESCKIEGCESGVSMKQRGNGARTLRRSGDCWHGGDGINLVDRVGWGGDDGGVCMLKEDSSILI